MLSEIQELYEYNRWANRRILQACANLTDAEFTRDLRNSFPSVRDTLVHIVGAEWLWVTRWKGSSPAALPSASDEHTREGLLAWWAAVEEEQSAFLAQLDESALAEIISYVNFRGERCSYTLWQMLRHVVNHSTYHRGQITTMLRQLGRPVVSTDLLRFYDDQRAIAS